MIQGNIYFYLKHKYLLFHSVINNFLKNPYKKGIPVFMLHSVGNSFHKKDRLGIRISCKKLQFIFDFITYNKIETLFINELNNTELGEKIALTFDDGYMDNYTEVLPLLEKYQIKATVFISPGEILEKKQTMYPLLNKTALIKLFESPFIEIGYHSYYHEPIYTFSQEKKEELQKGLQELYEIGIKPTSFSFPHGIVPNQFHSYFKEIGITASADSHSGYYKKEDIYAIPRLEISRHSSLTEIKAKIKQVF